MYFILVIMLLTSINLLLGQPTFEKTYGSSNYEEIWESKLLSDSTIVHAGYTKSGNAYFIKSKLNGDTIWTKELVDAGLDLLYSVQETVDKGIIAAGRSNSFGAGVLDIYLVKLNKNGNVLWRKAIGGSADESANEIKQTFDRGFVIVGNTYSYGSGGNDFYIVKTDSLGNILWTKTIGGGQNDNAYSVFETYNKDIVVAGLTTESNIDVMIARLDKNGTIKWVNKYGNAGDDRANSIIENSSKELIINGHYNGQDILLFKTDSLGLVLWAKSYGGLATDWGYSVKNTKDNNLIFCGYQGVPSFLTDYLIVKTDQLGDTLWAKNYGNSNGQFATNLEECYDKSIFITGYSQIAATDYDYLIIRTDSMGRTYCTNRNAAVAVSILTLTSAAKIYTVSNGGSVTAGSQTITSFCNMNVLCQSPLIGTDLSEINKYDPAIIYPNPTSNLLYIRFSLNDTYNISVSNILGTSIYSSFTTDNLFKVHLSDYSKGVYFLSITNSEGSRAIKKIILD
jgi:hypothetical protein